MGMETTGYSRWFERLLAELGFEVWIGDAAEIKTRRAKKKKTDREDARLLLKLLLEDRFPRIWVPSPENRDLRQLLWHRHRLVQMRTRIMNQLQALAMNENRYWKGKLWSERGRAELEKLPLAFWDSHRRQGLLELLDRMNPAIDELTAAAERSQEATGSGATDDASWGGPPHGISFVANRKRAKLLPLCLQLLGATPRWSGRSQAAKILGCANSFRSPWKCSWPF